MESLKKYFWTRSARRYQRLSTESRNKKKLKITRFRSKTSAGYRGFWPIRIIPKLRIRVVSPLKLLTKLKNSYINTMLGLVGKLGFLSHGNSALESKRIPRGRRLSADKSVYSIEGVEERLVYEIYLALKIATANATT